MTSRWNRRSFLAATAGVLATPSLSRKARAEDAIRLRCSLDTAPSHPRNQAITDYLAKLDEASQGRIKSVPPTAVGPAGQLWQERGPKTPALPGFQPPTSLAPLVKAVRPGVVNIATRNEDTKRSLGSGFGT